MPTRPVCIALATIGTLALLAGCNAAENTVTGAVATTGTASHDNYSFKFVGNPAKGERLHFAGLSIVPPQGEHWIEGPHHPEPTTTYFGLQPLATFVKVLPQTSEDQHSILARVNIVYIIPTERPTVARDQREYIRFLMDKEVATTKLSTTGRMQTRSVEAHLDNSLGACFRIDVTAEDRGAPGTANLPAMIEVHGLECLAPSSEFYVFAFYTQRTPHGVESVDLGSEGEEFLRSLSFSSGEGS